MLLSYILGYRILNSWVIPPPKEGGLWYDLYKKKEGGGGGGGSSPLFRGELRGGFEIVVTTFLQWN